MRWDPANDTVRISSVLARALGVTAAEIPTSVWRDRVHPDDRAAMAELVGIALAHRAPFDTEFRIVRPSGEPTWLQIKGQVDVTPDGRAYVFGSTADITERKQMESRLRLADRLIAAGTLAAGVAHEINNPLTYVLGSIHLMRRRLASHPGARTAVDELLTQMLDGIERIRTVVADVRRFARKDDEEDLVVVDPRAVCASAIRIVSADVRHRATLTAEYADDTPNVLANDARLVQVIVNLIVNASQAMPERAVDANRIVIRTRRRWPGEVVIEVEDNGAGIPQDVVPQLFDPFFTTKPIGLGTGLGLSVCQGIVAALGGRIDVSSALGRGSVFSVVLPAADAAHVTPPPPVPIVAAAPNGSGERVLVIDDEPVLRRILASSLSSSGYVVDEASNGRAGLDLATSRTAYRAIVCDVMMPDVDGATLYEQLVEHDPSLAARIVFISGGAVTPRARELLQRPEVHVLHKPFELDDLLGAIERITV
ncbi:MAG TPA: ATP-binding protein [Kofleriaceae bacterium]|nr:ATP-binding protein [Kofleriaceae bacterium]